jgi:pyruvate/2-oxoglutarate/acetoin dehydrogenase E1 component/TPP-dependent pyruvate/acetoin dehydrogenase alpha subunit
MVMESTLESNEEASDLPLSTQEIINDYRIAYRSRQASLIGRREVMGGKAKFGIFGDGKEVVQVAMAHAFRKGDWRAGYYRDQTFMFAIGELTVQQFFAQIYAHTDVQADPATAGRAMNGHYATRSLNPDGSWKDLTQMHNIAADVSPTAAQMPVLVGLAYASKVFHEVPELTGLTQFSQEGNEIAFGTIGNASCAEGIFWEALNAIGVIGAPALITVYDDGYGISVPNEQQLVKTNVSELLRGFQRDPGRCWGYDNCGYDIYTVHGWDYARLVLTFLRAAKTVREEHAPAILHADELTQPQGHSTSGSHERYKTPERLEWEREFDALKKFREWILEKELLGEPELEKIELEERRFAEQERKLAWEAYFNPIQEEKKRITSILAKLAGESRNGNELQALGEHLRGLAVPYRRDLMAAVREALILTRETALPGRQKLIEYRNTQSALSDERFHSHLYSQSAESPLLVAEVKPVYKEDSPLVYGFEVVNACFDAAFGRDPRLIAFGEDVGKLGDVNQGMRGMLEKYGFFRVTDTGIREATIVGQAIGMALRGLRPIAEVQYLDYLLYALQILSDELATLHWRTRGGQKAPVIIRTRGHRLEGIWHSGSPMASILHLVRGMHVLVPRDMTRAAGFYNTLLLGDDPGIIIEVLNGYRLRERLPLNIGELAVPLGVPEVIRQGTDITVVTYGACCRIVMEAVEQLSKLGIDSEVIDVQSLLPFDLSGRILESLKKTSRILFVDEDVPGGTTAYMLQEVIEKQGGYYWLDSPPRTLPGKPHRPAYGSDGDYWSKPNVEEVFEAVYEIMHEADPTRYPNLFE